MSIIITGSIAYDYLMSFPGKFPEHFLPEHMQRVSLSFLVDTMDKRRGGCAPNIAYTLALLGHRPRLMGTAGQDFGEYRQWLEAAGIDTLVLDHRAFPSRDEYDAELARRLRERGVTLVCLAGFMRLIGAPLLEAYPGAILNVHPSLLPAFPGIDAQRQALEHGVKVSGATVHLVTGELDGGPIVLQEAVPVLESDTPEALSARILEVEHRLYPEAAQLVLDGDWRVEGRRFRRGVKPAAGPAGATAPRLPAGS